MSYLVKYIPHLVLRPTVGHAGLSNRDTGPGPAAYSPETRRKNGFSFGGRSEQQGEDNSPGPAAYHPQQSRRGGISMGGRPQDYMDDLGPGPGEYYPGLGDSTKRSLPAWSIAGRHREPDSDELPGPGNDADQDDSDDDDNAWLLSDDSFLPLDEAVAF